MQLIKYLDALSCDTLNVVSLLIGSLQLFFFFGRVVLFLFFVLFAWDNVSSEKVKRFTMKRGLFCDQCMAVIIVTIARQLFSFSQEKLAPSIHSSHSLTLSSDTPHAH